jgi:hypothetical protein
MVRFVVLMLLSLPALAFAQATVLNNGLVVKGKTGPLSILRTDRGGDTQLELQNLTMGQHALLGIYNEDPAQETAIVFGTRFNDGRAWNTGAYFARTMNGWNGYGWIGVHGIHAVGHLRDSQIFTGWSNNSVRLAGGNVSTLPWNDPPASDTVELGYKDTGAVLVLHPVSQPPIPAPDAMKLYMLNGILYVMPPNGIPKALTP